jgi:hypothetical protein
MTRPLMAIQRDNFRRKGTMLSGEMSSEEFQELYGHVASEGGRGR